MKAVGFVLVIVKIAVIVLLVKLGCDSYDPERFMLVQSFSFWVLVLIPAVIGIEWFIKTSIKAFIKSYKEQTEKP